jgi:glycosyltransferase involved in cell wall biosynthesis
MKILYYLPSLCNLGGMERITTLKANYFAEQLGYDVVILTSEQQAKVPYFPLSDKIKTIDLDVVFDTNTSRSRIFKLLKYPFKYYLFKRRFSKVLYQQKPDITISILRRELYFIHSIRDGSAKIGEFHYTRQAYIPGSIQGNNLIKKILRKYWIKLFSSNLKKLSKVILLTNKELLNWAELTNTAVIHNPLSFYPVSTSKCEEKKVIAVGRYVYEKGFDLLVDTWKIVNQRHPDWKLHIYGEGKKESLTNQINSLHLSDSCILENPVKNIEEKYLESSIFVLSSRFEGFGMVIAEAMACGVPPVSFACPCGPKEIINDEEDGLLVEPENIQELANKICYLMENVQIRKQMGKKAHQNIKRLKIDNIVNQWVQLFNDLMSIK